MARTKKRLKAKEPIKLRFKTLTNGNKSIYLDIYADGKRYYEFLKLYLIPEKTELDKVKNANTLQDAQAIQAQRVIALADGKAGLSKANERGKILLLDWMEQYKQIKLETGQSGKNASTIDMLINHLKTYKGDAIEKVRLIDVDEAFCRGLIKYLVNDAMACYGKNKVAVKRLSVHTANQYFVHFASAMNEAVRRKIITSNPTKYLKQEDRKMLKYAEPQRGYLSVDEVRLLMATPNSRAQIKQAFILAVLCGLRISDIRGLKWSDLQQDGEQWKISVLMQKTGNRLYLPLSVEAIQWLPQRGEAKQSDTIFNDLPTSNMGINSNLKRWAKRAGIEKNICFHVSRHTFATSLITLGTDIYTTSKLLGHKKIATTQIYADIVGQKKVAAVNLLGEAFNK